MRKKYKFELSIRREVIIQACDNGGWWVSRVDMSKDARGSYEARERDAWEETETKK